MSCLACSLDAKPSLGRDHKVMAGLHSSLVLVGLKNFVLLLCMAETLWLKWWESWIEVLKYKSLCCPGDCPEAASGAHPVILPAMHTTGWHCGWPANRYPFTRTQKCVSKPAVSLEGAQHAEDGFHFGNVDAWGHVHFSVWGSHSAMASFSPLLVVTLNIKKMCSVKNGLFYSHCTGGQWHLSEVVSSLGGRTKNILLLAQFSCTDHMI